MQFARGGPPREAFLTGHPGGGKLERGDGRSAISQEETADIFRGDMLG